MMTWNHRVIKDEDAGEAYYAIHECFYNNKEDAMPTSWTARTIAPLSDTRTGLLEVLERMATAVRRPILEVKDGKLVEVEPAL